MIIFHQRYWGLLLAFSLLQTSPTQSWSQAVDFDDPGVRLGTSTNGNDQDAQAADDIEGMVDQVPNNIIHDGEIGFLAGAAVLLGAEILSAGTVTLPLAMSVLGGGAFLGVAAGESSAIDALTTALESIISGGDDQ